MIRIDETEIVGNWVEVDGKIVGDEACKRIRSLTEEYFQKLGSDWSGWETLFKDPNDGRFWERTYPLSHMHGGGPPVLLNLSEQAAKGKYAHLFGEI